MKILYLCPDLGIPVLGRKGASVHVRELIGAFERAGHSVVLAAQTLNKSPWEKPASIETSLIQVRLSSTATTAAQALKEFNAKLGVQNSLPGELRRIFYNRELESELKRRFENEPPDFIYERASLYATAGVGLAQHLKAPLIVELNAPLALEQAAYRSSGFGELAAQAERWVLAQADAVVVVSEALRQHVTQCGVPGKKVHVIPNGVNPVLFRPGPRDRVMRRNLRLDGGPVLGFVGGLRPWHGIEVLPEVVERLGARGRRVRLMIAGDGPLRGELESRFKERGLSDCILITGLRSHEEMPALIRQFDVALAPYPKADHAFYFSPLKLFEYMACGVPVVAASIGQIAEVLCHGKTGLLYSPGDVEALVAGCEKLLRNPKLRAKLSRAASRLVQAQFTWDKNAERVVQLASAARASPRHST